MRIGFAGLGAIGQPMAARLVANHELTVWNRTGSVAEAFAATHEVAMAPTPRKLAEGSEVLFTCLPSSREVVALLEGSEGLEAGLQPGTLVIDCTSGDPNRSRQIAGQLRERGAAFVDAAVSGGVVGAEAGTLTAMVGADSDTFDRARPVLGAPGLAFLRIPTMLKLSPILAGIPVVCLLATGLTAQKFLYSPPNAATKHKTSANTIPLGAAGSFGFQSRYQQVHSDVRGAAVVMDGLALRRDGRTTAWTATTNTAGTIDVGRTDCYVQLGNAEKCGQNRNTSIS